MNTNEYLSTADTGNALNTYIWLTSILIFQTTRQACRQASAGFYTIFQNLLVMDRIMARFPFQINYLLILRIISQSNNNHENWYDACEEVKADNDFVAN